MTLGADRTDTVHLFTATPKAATDAALQDLSVLVLDCQSTGASPTHGHLLEVGWARTSARDDADDDAIASRLVALPDDVEIPAAVRRITGIDHETMADARSDAEVWTDLVAALPPDRQVPTVIHFARFEEPFLRQLHATHAPERPFPFHIVCTHEIAKRLLPDLPRRGLRALAGYFGCRTGELKRSAAHVAATVAVWRNLAARLEREHGVADLADLQAWLQTPVPARTTGRAYPMPRTKRLALPDGPGVYRLLDREQHVLYVGKATSLRRRVNSYFQKRRGQSERMLELLSQVRDVDLTAVATPLEAALLEVDEIKRLDPPYNRALRGRGRGVWFSNAAWTAVGPQRTTATPLGPWSSAYLPRAGAALVELVRSGGEATRDPDALRHLVQHRGDAPPAPEILAAGLEAFVAAAVRDRGAWPASIHGLLRLGHARRDRLAARRDDLDDDDDGHATETEPDAEAWTPQRVTNVLDDVAARVAHAVRRMTWLRRLADATIVFSELAPIPRRRVMTVAAGRIGPAADLPIGAPLPPAPPRRTRRELARTFDLATTDRLRVLSTELRRLVTAHLPVTIRPATGPAVDALRLQRGLNWV